MKFPYLWDRFEYCLNKSIHPKNNFKLKPCSAYFGDGAVQSQKDTVAVISDCSSSPRQTTPPSQSDVGVHEHTFFQLPRPPEIAPSNFHVDLVVSPIPHHMYFVPQPLSSYSDHPPDDTVLCSSILDSTLVLNEDRSIDGVDVTQLTCFGIHEEHDREFEHPPPIGDHPCLSIHHLFFLDILDDPTIPDFSCASPSLHAPIVDHSKDTPDISPPSDKGEYQSFIENTLDLSSSFF